MSPWGRTSRPPRNTHAPRGPQGPSQAPPPGPADGSDDAAPAAAAPAAAAPAAAAPTAAAATAAELSPAMSAAAASVHALTPAPAPAGHTWTCGGACGRRWGKGPRSRRRCVSATTAAASLCSSARSAHRGFRAQAWPTSGSTAPDQLQVKRARMHASPSTRHFFDTRAGAPTAAARTLGWRESGCSGGGGGGWARAHPRKRRQRQLGLPEVQLRPGQRLPRAEPARQRGCGQRGGLHCLKRLVRLQVRLQPQRGRRRGRMARCGRIATGRQRVCVGTPLQGE
jgi:hypothetical protein